MSYIITDEGLYKCKICGVEYKSYHSWYTHNQRQHTDNSQVVILKASKDDIVPEGQSVPKQSYDAPHYNYKDKHPTRAAAIAVVMISLLLSGYALYWFYRYNLFGLQEKINKFANWMPPEETEEDFGYE